MKLSNQNIYNLRGTKTFGGGAKCLWGGGGGKSLTPPENLCL
jgi:hypothetical protein